MIGLCALAQMGFLGFDEIADLGFFFQHRAGAQACEGPDFATAGDLRAFDMAVGADFHIVRNAHTGTEKHIRFNQDIAANLRVPCEPDGFRRDQRRAVIHRLHAAALLPFGLHLGQLCAAVDARHVKGIRGDCNANAAIGVRNVDDVREIIFLLRIVVRHAAQQAKQIA